MIRITPAHPEDRDALHRLLTRSWLETWAPHLPADAVARFHAADPVAAELDAHLQDILVARLDGRVAGMLAVVGETLESLHVDDDLWGKGVGTALFRHAEGLGARRLEVRAFNARAIAFYQARGWVETERRMATEMGVPAETLVMRGPEA